MKKAILAIGITCMFLMMSAVASAQSYEKRDFTIKIESESPDRGFATFVYYNDNNKDGDDPYTVNLNINMKILLCGTMTYMTDEFKEKTIDDTVEQDPDHYVYDHTGIKGFGPCVLNVEVYERDRSLIMKHNAFGFVIGGQLVVLFQLTNYGP